MTFDAISIRSTRRSRGHRGSATGPTLLALVLGTLLAAAVPAGAEPTFYVDVEGGKSTFERGFGESHPWTFDDGAAVWGLALGTELYPFLGVEIGYRSTSGFAGQGSACWPSPTTLCIELVADVEAELEVWTAAVVPTWRVGRVALLARIGVGYSEQKLAVVEPFANRLGRLSDTELLYGVGARVELNRRLDLLVDYEVVEVGLETASLGLGYRF